MDAARPRPRPCGAHVGPARLRPADRPHRPARTPSRCRGNLVADPAAAPATVAGALACIAPFPWLRDGLTALAWVPAAWIAAVAHTTTAVSAQNLPWPTVSSGRRCSPASARRSASPSSDRAGCPGSPRSHPPPSPWSSASSWADGGPHRRRAPHRARGVAGGHVRCRSGRRDALAVRRRRGAGRHGTRTRGTDPMPADVRGGPSRPRRPDALRPRPRRRVRGGDGAGRSRGARAARRGGRPTTPGPVLGRRSAPAEGDDRHDGHTRRHAVAGSRSRPRTPRPETTPPSPSTSPARTFLARCCSATSASRRSPPSDGGSMSRVCRS